MSKRDNFEIDLEIHKLELEGIDKILDIVKLIVAIGLPVCAGLLYQGPENWWQWVPFGVLFGVVLGAFIEMFNLTGERNIILSEMKQVYLGRKYQSSGILTKIKKRISRRTSPRRKS